MPGGSGQNDNSNVNTIIMSDEVPNVYSEFLTENVEVRHDMDDGYVSDDLESLSGSDVEGEVVSKDRFPRFRKEDLCKEFKFKLGMEFASLKEFKDAILEHSILNGKEVTFEKNDTVRVRQGWGKPKI
ncbi:hypothetical protein SESBI_33394 [Sesbania bispinosa]|nr:hypothetical protein SESBI_33394 [Sesbania bispinosa]